MCVSSPRQAQGHGPAAWGGGLSDRAPGGLTSAPGESRVPGGAERAACFSLWVWGEVAGLDSLFLPGLEVEGYGDLSIICFLEKKAGSQFLRPNPNLSKPFKVLAFSQGEPSGHREVSEEGHMGFCPKSYVEH